MYETRYDPRTRTLTVIGDSYDIDQVTLFGDLPETRLLLRSSTLPPGGLEVAEKGSAPVNVCIINEGDPIMGPLKMIVTPALNTEQMADSHRRILSLTQILEEQTMGSRIMQQPKN